MKHLDLFSGIGGFALALDQVVESEHVFCDNDLFCQEILKKNFPNAKIYDDIRGIKNESADIITGGFPCQPFSQAGRRRGTEDDRYLWPEMFRVIQLAKPTWVIGENVGGFVTYDNGMVLEQVCIDLEGEGYEVQPFIIPAVSKNAPHRRDRIWIVGYSQHNGLNDAKNRQSNSKGSDNNQKRKDKLCQSQRTNSLWADVANTKSQRGRRGSSQERSISERQLEQGQQKGREIWGEGERRVGNNATDTVNTGLEGWSNQSKRHTRQQSGNGSNQRPDWNENWLEIATIASRVDDGLPNRVHRIKALGNSIVPQVAEEIMRQIFV